MIAGADRNAARSVRERGCERCAWAGGRFGQYAKYRQNVQRGKPPRGGNEEERKGKATDCIRWLEVSVLADTIAGEAADGDAPEPAPARQAHENEGGDRR